MLIIIYMYQLPDPKIDIHYIHDIMCSSPSLLRPPSLPNNCGHTREVAFGEMEKYIDISGSKDLWPY